MSINELIFHEYQFSRRHHICITDNHSALVSSHWFLGSYFHLTNTNLSNFPIFSFILFHVCLTSQVFILFSVDFESVAKIEVLCDTSAVISSTNLLYIWNFVSQLGAKIVTNQLNIQQTLWLDVSIWFNKSNVLTDSSLLSRSNSEMFRDLTKLQIKHLNKNKIVAVVSEETRCFPLYRMIHHSSCFLPFWESTAICRFILDFFGLCFVFSANLLHIWHFLLVTFDYNPLLSALVPSSSFSGSIFTFLLILGFQKM